jgi:hypothetical protein
VRLLAIYKVEPLSQHDFDESMTHWFKRVPFVGNQVVLLFVVLAFVMLKTFAYAATLESGSASSAEQDSQKLSSRSAIEQFKNFISAPPVIANLLFQRKVPMGDGTWPLDGSFVQSTRFEYFQAKWQTNGLLFRRLGSPDDATNSNVASQLVAWSGHRHTLLEPKQLLTSWDDRDSSTVGKKISVFYTSQFFLDPLRQILNLGIMHVNFGTIRWEGNRFRVQNEVDHEIMRATGELLVSVEGPPQRLNVHYELQGRTNDYVIRYGYSPTITYPCLPSTITNFWVSDGKEIELDEWKILQCEFSPSPLPPEAFSAERFEKQHHFAMQVYTNGAFYEVTPNGTLRFLQQLREVDQPSLASGASKLRAFYGIWGATNFTIFALAVRARNKAKPQTETTYELQV